MVAKRMDYDALYTWLVRCAEEGEPVPPNTDIAIRFGMISGSSGASAIAWLERTGRIRVERTRCARRVTIVASDRSTPWSSRKKPVALRAPHSPAIIEQVMNLHADDMTYLGIAGKVHLTKGQVCGIIERHRPRPVREAPLAPSPLAKLQVYGPSHTCTWIEGLDYIARQDRGDAIFCGEKSLPGKSYCPAHFHIVAAEIQPPPLRWGAR